MNPPASRRHHPRAFAEMFAMDVLDNFRCEREGAPIGELVTHRDEPWTCWHCYARFALAAIRKLRGPAR